MKSASFVFLSLLCCVVVSGVTRAIESEKQPVFLLCPHTEHFSAWSLYVLVDKSDPSKVLALGLDKLKGKNGTETPRGYEGVLAAQSDPKTATENLGQVDAKDFGTRTLEVKQDEALKVSVSPMADGLRLMISMRLSLEQRFIIGGKEQNQRDIVLRYDAATHAWGACALILKNAAGKSLVDNGCRQITGIVFPVSGTGIYRIMIVMRDGAAALVLDRDTSPKQE